MARMFVSKKADFDVLLAIIGVVLVGIILLIVGYKIVMGSNKMNQDEKCRLSIFAADQAASIRRKTAGSVDIVPTVQCLAEDILIKPADVKRSKNSRIDDDLVKRKLADELVKCWNKVGQGQLDPFYNAWKFGDRAYCMICSNIAFSKDFIDEAQKEPSYKIEGLNYWMATRRVPNMDKTYFQYVYGTNPSAEDIVAMKDPSKMVNVDFNEKFVVFWRVRFEDNRPLSLAVFAINPVGGFMLAVQRGSGYLSEGSFLLKQERLSGTFTLDGKEQTTCTIMVN